MSQVDFDTRRFRDALGSYASGLTIVTTLADDIPVGFTCQSFFSLSLDPPLVCFAVQKTSTSWPKIRPAEKFAINILASDQIETSRTFGRSLADRWASTTWVKSPSGNPHIEGTLLGLDCSIYSEHEAGDHWLVIANVHNMTERSPESEATPLVYYRGRYHEVSGIEAVLEGQKAG